MNLHKTKILPSSQFPEKTFNNPGGIEYSNDGDNNDGDNNEMQDDRVSPHEMAELARSFAPDYVYLDDLNPEQIAAKDRRFRRLRGRLEKRAHEKSAPEPSLRRDDVWQSEPQPLRFGARVAVCLAPLYSALYDWQLAIGAGVREVHHKLTLPQFPIEAAPLKIAFLSDLHLGPTSGRNAARQAWKIARESRPDVLLLGGDFLYADERGLPALLRELQRWKHDAPPGGMYACLGDHDYQTGADTLVMALEACGVRVLINESVELPHPWRGVYIAGADDERHGEAHPDEALLDVPRASCTILLAHSPDVCEHEAVQRCALTLSGHTHGGQICWPNREAVGLSSQWSKTYPYGLHRHAGNWVFVSRGVGTTGLPLRLFSPPDVAVLEVAKNWNGKNATSR
jgi:predicted MPP superfamily phosphohydrolase